MAFYEKYFLPKLLDCCCGMEGFQKKRAQIIPRVQGRVLEIGIGSGLNFDFYDFEKVDEVIGVDPAVSSVAIAKSRASNFCSKISFIEATAESIDLESSTFDSVVIGFSLCTIPDARAALAEMYRVLKPGGRLVFCEHGEAPDASVAQWQRRVNPTWRRLLGGCNLNRPIVGLIRDAQFRVGQFDQMYLPGTPRIAGYNVWGSAER